jgi:hypothetical protein
MVHYKVFFPKAMLSLLLLHVMEVRVLVEAACKQTLLVSDTAKQQGTCLLHRESSASEAHVEAVPAPRDAILVHCKHVSCYYITLSTCRLICVKAVKP